jgi:DNA-binding NtrC family response regulator
MKFNVLVIDDEQLVCKSIKRILEDQEKQVFTALNYPEAEKILKQQSIDLVLLDYKLGDQDGLFVLKEIRDQYSDLSIIMITAHGNIDVAVEAMKHGAYDFIQKKEDPEFIRLTVERTLDNLRLKKEVEELKSSHIHNACLPRIITVSKSMQSTIDLAREFAKSDSTVLIVQPFHPNLLKVNYLDMKKEHLPGQDKKENRD